VQLYTTLINDYGECCCRVRSNGKAGISIWEAAHRTLVTVCDKFQLVRCSQSVVGYG